jgi:hypothetical protein
MTKKCILHFGMPKTGTTSIQGFLRHQLTDPAFLYPHFNEDWCKWDSCHNRVLSCAFRSDPERFHTNAKENLTPADLAHRGVVTRDRLRELVQVSEANTLLLSAEDLSWFSRGDVCKFIKFLHSLNLETSSIAYVRAFKRDQESRFQQSIREPGAKHLSKPRPPGFFPSCYQLCISAFDEFLGPSNVVLFSFDRDSFESGCVVRSFCKNIGIKIETAPEMTSNDSLSAEALNLLYAYRLCGPGYGSGIEAMHSNWRLVEKFSELKGPRLFFHSSMLTIAEEKWRADLNWSSNRTGFDLLGDLYEDDDKPCVRSTEDMLRFSPTSLEWLAREADIKKNKLSSGDPQEVAKAVHALRLKLSNRNLRIRLRDSLKPFLPEWRILPWLKKACAVS